MEKYYTIEEWRKVHPEFSYRDVRLWVQNGMNHIGHRPIRFTQRDVDEFLDYYKVQCRVNKMEKQKKTHERLKPVRIMNHYNKIDEDFIYEKREMA